MHQNFTVLLDFHQVKHASNHRFEQLQVLFGIISIFGRRFRRKSSL